MLIDHSRNKRGRYAIVDAPPDFKEKYHLREVLKRDDQGNVLRAKQQVLSSRNSIEALQALIDKWERGDDVKLVHLFNDWQDAWEEKRLYRFFPKKETQL